MGHSHLQHQRASSLLRFESIVVKTRQDVRRQGSRGDGHRQWLRNGQGWLRRRRRSPRRLPLRHWTSPSRQRHGRYGQQGCLRRRRGSVQERYPLLEIPHRARYCDQLGQHGEGLASHLQQRVENLPSTPRATGRSSSRSSSRPSTPPPPMCASRPFCPSTPLAEPLAWFSTSEMVSPTPSPSMRVTPFPTPSCVSTWPDAT